MNPAATPFKARALPPARLRLAAGALPGGVRLQVVPRDRLRTVSSDRPARRPCSRTFTIRLTAAFGP